MEWWSLYGFWYNNIYFCYARVGGRCDLGLYCGYYSLNIVDKYSYSSWITGASIIFSYDNTRITAPRTGGFCNDIKHSGYYLVSLFYQGQFTNLNIGAFGIIILKHLLLL